MEPASLSRASSPDCPKSSVVESEVVREHVCEDVCEDSEASEAEASEAGESETSSESEDDVTDDRDLCTECGEPMNENDRWVATNDADEDSGVYAGPCHESCQPMCDFWRRA